jgi:adenosylhomocysteinase
MNDGTILANAGHFSWEMDLESLRQNAEHTERLTADIEQFTLANGRRLMLLTQGEMLNLAGGSGNPAETMDLGLSLQAASLLYLVQQRQHLILGPQPVPHSVNNTIAGQMLKHLSYKM